jgi:hypothetical protein
MRTVFLFFQDQIYNVKYGCNGYGFDASACITDLQKFKDIIK